MIYKKSKAKTLSKETFRDPGKEFRGAPFWAWNCKLDKELLSDQIAVFDEMGLGGYHMHVRTGLDTEYLGREYMDCVRHCVEEGKKRGMYSYLYDEDRWPSGAAGGIVTKDRSLRGKTLLISANDTGAPAESDEVKAAGDDYFLAAYDIELDGDGKLVSYKRIGRADKAEFRKRYAFCLTHKDESWYNGQGYADTLSPEAINKFIEVTHEAYYREEGAEFGKSIPSIFTDEPQFPRKRFPRFALSEDDVTMPWTNGLDAAFAAAKGYSLLDKLPLAVWTSDVYDAKKVKYDFCDFVAERFAEAFADNIGSWCDKHGIYLTGHLMEEPTLHSQANAVGEAMRSYRSFGMPGIDMLCDNVELATAKQCQSAVHQYGREGALSELYGVTGWDFDFKGHKFQGDWQAALGVTLRVHHLAWLSMEGDAKRDYPASISYQSSWYKQYRLVEDHFARLNTALTRGKPVVKVGVIHPIESYWLNIGPNDKTDARLFEFDEDFNKLIYTLLSGKIDFDFICESNLPDQCAVGSFPLKVGEMEYDAVVLCDCETIRSSTLERLKAFKAAGGKVIFCGGRPGRVDALPNEEAGLFYDECVKTELNSTGLVSALEDERIVDVINEGRGTREKNWLYNLRRDSNCDWLFITGIYRDRYVDCPHPTDLIVTVKGEFTPELWDTDTGDIKPVTYKIENGRTLIYLKSYPLNSYLFRLGAPRAKSKTVAVREGETISSVTFTDPLTYKLSEDNAVLLDMADYKFDNGKKRGRDELLRLDNAIRDERGMEPRGGGKIQPWVIAPEKIKHSLTLYFDVESEIEYSGARLAIERPETLEIVFNGEKISTEPDGWYVDKSIKTLPLPIIKQGVNKLTVKLPFGDRTNTEWCYILGKFGVRVEGSRSTIVAAPAKLQFGDITRQGLPFYGGAVTYNTSVNAPDDCAAEIEATFFRGAAVGVTVDGERAGTIIAPPYKICVPMSAGRHKVAFTVWCSRFNAFGAVHCCDLNRNWHGPDAWRTSGSAWSYEYRLKETGILRAPVITFKKLH
ncbi:MAG: hypothetical protein IJM45_09665 [Clostridia bacterium]|nr:hypothetical protein [Clostridia bacterium]